MQGEPRSEFTDQKRFHFVQTAMPNSRYGRESGDHGIEGRIHVRINRTGHQATFLCNTSAVKSTVDVFLSLSQTSSDNVAGESRSEFIDRKKVIAGITRRECTAQ